ncbi:Rossmann-like domain-containing protein [Imhoffiella purpurea]|uniref:Heavy-metal chelation domain-containing protein n=1 Tax=Imhoffiella purpurea TaxID=1249627 RepID=W9V3L6_9GAMM|nr:DUF364 domain-containing protein [Imhoffiella purpurea]EXJ14108.1 hypothetical protein D779_2993 [Imhoffiella purpurea]
MNEETRWPSDPLLETLARCAIADLEAHPLILEDLSLGQPISWALVRDREGLRALGTAMTPVGESVSPGPRYPGLPLDWTQWPLAELPGRIMADHPLERCLALAVINAVSQHRLAREGLAGVETGEVRSSVVRWVAERNARRVVVVGNMGPLVNGLAEAGVPHVVFERSPGNRVGALPDAQEWAWLAKADGLVLTGATLLNHTLAPILSLAREARFRLLVGFSAQAHPEYLAGCGATHAFSLHIRNIDPVRRLLQVGNWNSMFESETGYLAELDAVARHVR